MNIITNLVRLILANFVVIPFLLLGLAHGDGEKEEIQLESNRIAVVANKWLYAEKGVEANVTRYLEDLKNEGYDPILKIWDLENDPSPAALRGWLKGRYEENERLQGAVFIGNVPVPNVWAKDSYAYCEYIAEMYYMDLLGSGWYIFDDYEFNKNKVEHLKQLSEVHEHPMPTIWISLITTSTLSELFNSSESELVNAYLEKNHAYRTGQVVFPKQALLYSLPKVIEDDQAFNRVAFAFNDVHHILSQKYALKEEKPAYIDEFFEPLENESYEVLFWGRHGRETKIDLGYQKLESSLLSIMPVGISTAFVFPMSCLIGHYPEPGYFAGSYIFNKRSFVLGMTTAALVTQGGPEVEMINQFIVGNNLGIAFRESIKKMPVETSNFEKIASRNSRFIIGDGTLKLQSDELEANESNSPNKYLAEHYPYSINKKSLDKYISTYRGAKYIEEFLKMGIHFDKFNLSSAMLNAVSSGNKELVEWLLETDIDLVNTKDRNGNTVLMQAASKGNVEIVELLLAYQALQRSEGMNEEVLALLRAAEEKKEL